MTSYQKISFRLLPFSLRFIILTITVIIIVLKGKLRLTEKTRKHSKKRDAILEVIKSTKTHPGAQWVYERLKPAIADLSLATVYRNLGQFKEKGILASLGVVKGEERFDAAAFPHPHAVCTRCGKVEDLPEEVQAELMAEFNIKIPGFVIDKRNTMFYGLCNDCHAKITALGR
jgi:Fur family peroxide stress response transcriptional regulator